MSRACADKPFDEIADQQVMVVTPSNIKELQAADKYCTKVMNFVDSLVKQVLL